MKKLNSVTLGEIGKIVTGKTPPTNDRNNFGKDYMFITPVDLHNNFIIERSEKMISEKGIETVRSSIIDGFSVVVGCIGWDMGNVALVTKKCITNQQINSITNIKNSYNPFYIYYWLKNKKKYLFSIANVTRTPILNKTDFSNISIDIPSKKIQDQIASILSSLDKKIELNNKINQKLEAMAKMLYDYWFVQFDFPDANGKPYKSSGGKMVYNKELKREIPEGWNIQSLKDNDFTKILKPSINQFSGKKIYLATADVKNTSINFYAETITYNNRPSRANMQPIPNSVWFAKMKNSKKILYIGEYSKEFIDNFILSTGFIGLKVKKNALEYLWSFIYSNYFEMTKDKLANGATQEAINNDDLSFIKIIIPDKNTLNMYHVKTNNIYKKIYLNKIENLKLTQLRDWLLPMLMNGQIKISEAANIVQDALMVAEPETGYRVKES